MAQWVNNPPAMQKTQEMQVQFLGGGNLNGSISALWWWESLAIVCIYNHPARGAIRMVSCSFDKFFILFNPSVLQLWFKIKSYPR